MLHVKQNKVEIGDVLDEINENVINGDSKGKLRKIMKKTSGQPITLHIIKVYTFDHQLRNRIFCTDMIILIILI